MPPLTPPPSLPISTPSLSSSPVTTFVTAMAHKPPVSSFIGAVHPPIMPKHCTYPSVPCTHDFVASRVSNELMKLSVPAAVLHVATTESLLYISPVSSSIHAKLGLEAIALHGRNDSFSCSFPTYLSTAVVTVMIYFFFPTYVLLISYLLHFTSLTVLFLIINSTPHLLLCISCSTYHSTLHSVPPMMRHLDMMIYMDHFGL